MRINMWMLANMLRDENPIIDIDPNAESDLFGVGFNESPGRVCIDKEGSDILCYSKNSKILLKNCSFMYAFERVQHIFDYYNEWHDNVAQFCKSEDWQSIVDGIYPQCQNPIVFFDVNHRVLSMSARFPRGTVDEEWDFLLDYGVASERNIKAGRSNPRFREHLYEGANYFLTESTPSSPHEYLTISIKQNGEPWGFISSVSTVNKFTKGEIDAFMALTRTIENFLPQTPKENHQKVDYNIFKEYLTDVNSDNLDLITHSLGSFGWSPSDRYCVICTLFPNADNDELIRKMYISASNALSVPIVVLDNRLAFILDADSVLFEQILSKLTYLAEVFSATLVQSLCISDIKNLYYCYNQVCYIIDNVKLLSQQHYNFYDYAVNYIISNSDKFSLYHACSSELLKLLNDNQKNTELAYTLDRYLGNERSLQKTAQELGIHKNTITYRIQKALELTSFNLDDPYVRMYIFLSFTVLKIFNFI